MSRLLVVDDEAQMRRALKAVLKRKGFDVVVAEDGRQALSKLDEGGFNAVISDVRMPRMSGIELLRSIKKKHLEVPVLMMTAYGTIEDAIDAMKEGAIDYILKPFSAEIIESALKKALAPEGAAGGKGIVAKSKKMAEILSVAASIAPTTATVLITGESGTGKELLARFIHASSDRADAPFITVNCASIPDGLLESELFGHEKGAFTGADRLRIGKFEKADGGTLLLDEIGDMGLSLQAKLLRALQEREIDRVGGKKPIPVDIRIISTTNIDLKSAVSEKTFREDLFYRLNVFPFILPPLRERPEDIEYLAAHFLRVFSKKYSRPAATLAKSALTSLKRNPWKGNIRELENVMERAVLIADGREITVEHLYYGEEEPVLSEEKRRGTIRDMERRLITDALSDSSGNKSKAAESLGITTRTLRNKLKEYDMWENISHG